MAEPNFLSQVTRPVPGHSCTCHLSPDPPQWPPQPLILKGERSKFYPRSLCMYLSVIFLQWWLDGISLDHMVDIGSGTMATLTLGYRERKGLCCVTQRSKLGCDLLKAAFPYSTVLLHWNVQSMSPVPVCSPNL